MSRIRGFKVIKEILQYVKKKNEADTASEKDDVEKNAVKDLCEIPMLMKTYEIHRKIGEGTFSSVYLGSLRREAGRPSHERSWFAMKHLVPTTHPTRVAHELRCLKEIGGQHNVVGVVECFRHLDTVLFIMPYMKHNKFSEYVVDMGADELRRYMRALLTALRHVHSFDVIHRDVKPSNFLYDRERGRFALVDFGLAQHIETLPPQPPPAHQKRPRDDSDIEPSAKRLAMAGPGGGPVPSAHAPWRHVPPAGGSAVGVGAEAGAGGCICAGAGGVCSACAARATQRANRAGTQGFRPPEVLFKYKQQTTAVDMWACGVIFLSLLSGKYPFFHPEDDLSALAEITTLCGTQLVQDAAAALGCHMVTSLKLRATCLRKLCTYLRGGAGGGASPLRRSCSLCRLRLKTCLCCENVGDVSKFDPTRTIAGFPDSAFALAYQLLEPNPRRRITAAAALEHPFLQP